MKQLLFIVVLSTLLLAGCKNKAPQSDTHEPPSEIDHVHIAQESEDNTLLLNEGKKWKADASTLLYVKAMENDLLVYASEKDTSQLHASLKDHLSKLIANCTMKGTAHDALHAWLLSFMETVDKLTTPEGASVVASVEEALAVFNVSFD